MIRVLVSGAAGKMGREVIQAVNQQSDMQIVAGVDPAADTDIQGVELFVNLDAAIDATKPDVVVDFTHPNAVIENIKTCLAKEISIVVGTTGLNEAELKLLEVEAKNKDWAAIIVPNFAIGAVLMMRFAKEAAQYFSDVEIIEYHHNEKKDAPSGTAMKTAEIINQHLTAREPVVDDSFEIIKGAAGAVSGKVRIHSVRLPGYVAHQEVIFSSLGQNLIIRHDSTHRKSFMPGVLLAIRKLPALKGFVYGLEQIL
ncbi:MAG: 4-hydroxy-tetrahydrodipicolinate reductase [Firmicutes bacterium]|nr:4-hydroxy-tetrahydrodipicolinate reductase [Bacillota bacterium]